MAFEFVVSRGAETDAAKIVAWYREHSRAAAERFESALDVCFTAVEESPELWALVDDSVRVAKVRKYPYLVYFRFDGQIVTVFAIVHHARDGSVWQSRL